MTKMEKMIDFIIHYSCGITRNDEIYLYFYGEPNDFLKLMMHRLRGIGCKINLILDSNEKTNYKLISITPEEATKLAKKQIKVIEKCSVFISLIAEEITIDKNHNKEYLTYQKYYKQPIRDARLNNCRWIGLRLPTQEMANVVNMRFEEFEKLYYNVCGIDYIDMEKENLQLTTMLAETKQITIIAPRTKLSFDKKDIPSRILCGKINLPDGEIYTSPEKYSVNGYISFNTTSIQAGTKFENIYLKFKDGKVVEANCNETQKLNSILNSDEGSRYVGEFGIGINDEIKEPIGLILFDEKIKGTIHFALGQSYKDAYNGNDSSLHWDLVLNMNKYAGGGIILFDNQVVFKDGTWLKK